jgi:hypothetical protein
VIIKTCKETNSPNPADLMEDQNYESALINKLEPQGLEKVRFARRSFSEGGSLIDFSSILLFYQKLIYEIC